LTVTLLYPKVVTTTRPDVEIVAVQYLTSAAALIPLVPTKHRTELKLVAVGDTTSPQLADV
jgi:hypothetical protein